MCCDENVITQNKQIFPQNNILAKTSAPKLVSDGDDMTHLCRERKEENTKEKQNIIIIKLYSLKPGLSLIIYLYSNYQSQTWPFKIGVLKQMLKTDIKQVKNNYKGYMW